MSGQDIQRKGTTRKAKFLFSLPGSLASVKGGTIGKISGMNTGTPTMTLHFPQVSAVVWLRSNSAAHNLELGCTG